MSVERARPWWASPDPRVSELDASEDPVRAVRSARLSAEAAAGDLSADRVGNQAADQVEDMPGGGGAADLGGIGDMPGGWGAADLGGISDVSGDPDGDASAGAGSAADGDGAEHPAGHTGDVCGTCPWCIGVRILTEAKPEVAAHLAEAGRHLAAAVRELLDDRPERAGRAHPRDPVSNSEGHMGDRARSHRDAPFERVHIQDVPADALTEDDLEMGASDPLERIHLDPDPDEGSP